MSDKTIPKARLLTMREVIGVDNPEEFGFGPITSSTESIILERLGDKKEDKLNIFKTRGIVCSTVMNSSYKCYNPTQRKNGDMVIFPSDYRVKNDYHDFDEIRHLAIGAQGNIEPDSDVLSAKVRVVFPWSKIKDYCQDVTTADDGIIEAEYGLWPINDASYDWLTNELLELLYINQERLHALKALPLNFTVNHEGYTEDSPCTICPVFEYNDALFARIEENVNGIGGNYNWVSLQPLKLWVDEEKDVAVTAYTVCRIPKYDDTKAYLENFFSKEVYAGAMFLKGNKVQADKSEEKPMFPGIPIVEEPQASTYQTSPSPKQEEEKPMFPGIEIVQPQVEELPKKIPGKQIVKVRIKSNNKSPRTE